MEVKEVVKGLLASGAKKIEGIKVKNVTIVTTETYTRCGLTLEQEVDGYIADKETGEFSKGKTSVIFVSLFSLTSILKNNSTSAFAANHIVENPKSIGVLLSQAEITVVQEQIIAGQEYKNPWSSREDAQVTVFDHDTIINHVIDIKLNDFAKKMLEHLAFSLMGI